MSRACACERLWRQLESDVRLRTLPMAAQHLWLRLARLALATTDGVLRLGSEFGFVTAVSLAVSAAETEVETQIETLLRRGLVLRDGDALTLPGLQPDPRAAAAQANGRKGGRPRKGETAEQMHARRQGAFMLPVQGGQVAAAKPKPETGGGAAPTTSSSSPSSTSRPTVVVGGAGGAGRDWIAVGEDIALLAGLDPAKQKFNYQPVRAWMERGWTREAILAGVRTVVARDSYDPAAVYSLTYFAKAIEREMAEGAAPASPQAAPAADLTPRSQAILAWARGGCQGPAPSVAA